MVPGDGGARSVVVVPSFLGFYGSACRAHPARVFNCSFGCSLLVLGGPSGVGRQRGRWRAVMGGHAEVSECIASSHFFQTGI